MKIRSSELPVIETNFILRSFPFSATRQDDKMTKKQESSLCLINKGSIYSIPAPFSWWGRVILRSYY